MFKVIAVFIDTGFYQSNVVDLLVFVQLRERLCLLQEKKMEEEDATRDGILAAKEVTTTNSSVHTLFHLSMLCFFSVIHSLFVTTWVHYVFQAKDQMLMDTLQTISRHRTETSKKAAIK